MQFKFYITAFHKQNITNKQNKVQTKTKTKKEGEKKREIKLHRQSRFFLLFLRHCVVFMPFSFGHYDNSTFFDS